ncbi:TonB-dependent receptor [Flavobacteriaceae bacterium F89]|uniref:TonB-dependent receptor n=1 Tax=Cerina litoralis TaxID=2874477 RepID=A0AAE3ESX5_9FLAO|nr:TonB-dependent receptor [Cerina litoralis]MCG2459865.1 TonB-dependent receptor [Cerina litoralis]
MIFRGKAQEISVQKISLPNYLEKLELEYHIKFSYIDADLQSLQVSVPTDESLTGILQNLHSQTNLKFSKLNDRYYTITQSDTVDLCAKVLDNFEKNTLIGATIEVLGSNIHLVTDGDGHFRINDVARNARIAIKHIGFKTQYILAKELQNNNPCTLILMSPKYQELNEVVVYRFLTTGISKEQDGSIRLETDKFGILPGQTEPDVLQAIQALPGIKSVDETVSEINVRGGTNDQNLILWDGIKMYQSGHFFGMISAFDPNLTKNVSVIKNGTSVEFGDGVSSVIKIESDNEVRQTFEGGAGINLLYGDLYGHIPLSDKVSLQFSGRRSFTDFLDTPIYDRFYEKAFQDSDVQDYDSGKDDSDIVRNDDFYFYDVSGKLLYDINANQKLRLSFIHINNHLNYSEKSGDNNDQRILKQNNLSFGGSLESAWTPRFRTFLNLYYTQYDLEAQTIASESQQLYQSNQVLEKALKLNSNFTLGNTLNWLNGYQLNEVGITNLTQVTQPDFKSNIKGVNRTHSLFSEMTYTSMDKKWFARGGIRLNYIKNLKTFHTFDAFFIEPRINFGYAFVKSIKVEFMGEFKSQTTNQIIDLEQNFLGIEKRRWILSDNDRLPITKSKQASLGLNYEKRSLYIGAEGFYKMVDGISTATQGFQNKDQFNGEIGAYHIWGVEFLINKKTPTYSAWLSYSFNRNNYYFDDLVPHEFPNNLDIRHTVTIAGTYTFRDFHFGLGANYHSGKPYTEPLESDPINTTVFPNKINYAEPNSSRIPDYLRADASCIYHFNMGHSIKASTGVSVLNILDNKNILNTYFRLNEQNEIETIERVSLGITPNISFRISF